MPDDGFDLSACDLRNPTPAQRGALRKIIVSRAHQARHRAIRDMVMGVFAAIRSAWRRRRDRQQARQALRSMTDRELRDIGVSRMGIEAAIRTSEAATAEQPSRERRTPVPRVNWRGGADPWERLQSGCRSR